MEWEDPERPDLADESIELLRGARDYILSLPSEERHIAAMAADGAPVWQIAQEMRISDAAVANALSRIVSALSGREIEQVETGGLGADTDPGVTGGYDTEPFGDR